METPNISRAYPSVTGARAHSCRPGSLDSPTSRHHAGCEYPRFSHSADRCASSRICQGLRGTLTTTWKGNNREADFRPRDAGHEMAESGMDRGVGCVDAGRVRVDRFARG